MTRKHFRKLANELHSVQPSRDDEAVWTNWYLATQAVAESCAVFNERFNRDAFLTACCEGC